MEKIFEINIYTSIFWGVFLGSVNGSIIKYFLRKYFNNTKKFLLVFAISFLYKLVFLIVSIFILRNKKVIIVLLYCFFLILMQIFFEILAVYGAKRDT